MTSAAVRARGSAAGARGGAAHHGGTARTGRGGTLGAVVGGAWEALLDHATAACPICGGAMHRRGAGGASCRSCGARLS